MFFPFIKKAIVQKEGGEEERNMIIMFVVEHMDNKRVRVVNMISQCIENIKGKNGFMKTQ